MKYTHKEIDKYTEREREREKERERERPAVWAESKFNKKIIV
jgi:hypothetical protein